MKETSAKVTGAILGTVIALAIAFGFHTLVVWGVCKIMGWTFAWKWVFLLMIVYALLSSIARKGKSDK